MTSTSFNVGLNGQTRNSSKVLKPPGGGSSDIFGAAAEPAEPQRKNTSHLTSSIFGGEDTVTPARKKADVNPVVNEAPSVNGSSSTNSAASTTAPTPTANSAPATAKPRIPPGGFSSGLW